jgi:hypothetical protein
MKLVTTILVFVVLVFFWIDKGMQDKRGDDLEARVAAVEHAAPVKPEAKPCEQEPIPKVGDILWAMRGDSAIPCRIVEIPHTDTTIYKTETGEE